MKRINKVNRGWYLFLTKFLYGRKFQKLGKRSILFSPMQVDNPEGISLGNRVFIAHNSWLMGGRRGLVIEDDVVIGHFCHIVAKESIRIEKNALLADKIFISDCTHSFEDITKPIIQQNISYIGDVIIGEGAWLGENVCVCGASVGKHCVIGANSVVTKDIPDYSVAVGAPARVIKQYDFRKNEWVKEC